MPQCNQPAKLRWTVKVCVKRGEYSYGDEKGRQNSKGVLPDPGEGGGFQTP